MLIPSRHLCAIGSTVPMPGAEPFTSFGELCARLRELGRVGRAGSAFWRHALETAEIARQAKGGDALISAALFQHVGPMVWFAGNSACKDISPGALAHFGADLLTELYAPAVTEPIRLQVSAQRYLAGSRSSVLRQLVRPWNSPGASMVESMTEPERECFAAMSFAADAIRLCRWGVDATGDAHIDHIAGSLRRIAARSVWNDGFGWESSWHEDDKCLSDDVT